MYGFRTGLPDKTVCEILNEKYPEPQIGDFYPYVDIETLFSCNREKARAYMLTWKRYLMTRRVPAILLVNVRGEGYKIANHTQANDTTTNEIDGVNRKIIRTAQVHNTVDPRELSSEARGQHDLNANFLAKSIGHMAMMKKRIKPPSLNFLGGNKEESAAE